MPTKPWFRYGGLFTVEGFDLWPYNDAAKEVASRFAQDAGLGDWWTRVRGARKRLVWASHYGERLPPFGPRQRLHVEPYGRWELEVHYRSTRRASEVDGADLGAWALRDACHALRLLATATNVPQPPLTD